MSHPSYPVPLCAIRGCFFAVLLSLSVQGFSAQKPEQDGWKLVWHDEFNGRKLDPKKWNVLTREQSKHNELQYYLPDEVYLENGSNRRTISGKCPAPALPYLAGQTNS